MKHQVEESAIPRVENIAYACLTKHVENGAADWEALRWVESDLTVQSFTYGDLERQSNRVAGGLKSLGVQPGETVSLFLPRSPILISTLFAIQKLTAISCILFNTLGEEGLFDRLSNSQTRVVVTRKSLLRKIRAIQPQLPALEWIVVVDQDEPEGENILGLKGLLADRPESLDYPHYVQAETPAFLQYTSGSTGKPKGALHVHDALGDMQQSFRDIMQLQPEDLYWCTADPAWITGMVYGILAPFSTGARQVQYGGNYHAQNWLSLLESERINVWYTAPTALRMLMQEPESTFQHHDFSALKRMYSVGEPLNPEIYHWGKKVFKVEIYDTWWQSETGSMMIGNHPPLPVKPGSMGKPRAGVDAFICDETMNRLPAHQQGLLCLRKGWGSMFRTYFHNEAAYAEKFRGDIYLSGDLAWQDEDGYFWYVSRADDVINTAGHLVGPFEVESALLELDEIVDVAVVGADDPILHQRIIAFVKLRPEVQWSRELELKCRIYVSNKVSTTAIPTEFHVIDRVPKNQSGKILRRVLKAVYEGKDPGDLSTME
ncbi:MAG: AMP-binding protein [Anaerolineaceae bacterium]